MGVFIEEYEGAKRSVEKARISKERIRLSLVEIWVWAEETLKMKKAIFFLSSIAGIVFVI